MKELLIWVCTLVCLVNGRPNDDAKAFSAHIREKGTEFSETVMLDDEPHIVTVHVPAHNNVDETYLISDTNQHLTMRVAPGLEECFLMQNDPMELPAKTKWINTKQVSKDEIIDTDNPDIHTVHIKHSYVITGAVTNRKALPHKMQQMCQDYPILRLDLAKSLQYVPVNDGSDLYYKNSTGYASDGNGHREKRQFAGFTCRESRIRARAVQALHNCYYVILCDKPDGVVNGPNGPRPGSTSADCVKHQEGVVQCLRDCCLDELNEPDDPNPYCWDANTACSSKWLCRCNEPEQKASHWCRNLIIKEDRVPGCGTPPPS